MKHITNKHTGVLGVLVLAVAMVTTLSAPLAFAEPMRQVDCNDGTKISVPGGDPRTDAEICKSHGGAKVVPTANGDTPKCAILPSAFCEDAKSGGTDVANSGVFKLLVWVLNIMTAGVGIAAVGALVYAGILYASAGGGSDQIVKSKKIITDTVIGIVVYALMFLVINWLVPGGVIG